MCLTSIKQIGPSENNTHYKTMSGQGTIGSKDTMTKIVNLINVLNNAKLQENAVVLMLPKNCFGTDIDLASKFWIV